jgi:8-oxo-dGTP pyrophosphatase MutT (NUDIX family)
MDESKNPWQLLGSTQVYENNWIAVTEFDVINPGGGKGIYGKVHFKGLATGVIPLDDAMNTYLVGQWRFPLGQYSWEIPEGGSPIGTDPLDSAKRELLEETGLTATDWSLIQTMHLSNSVSDEYALIYLARGLKQFSPSPEESEQLIIKKIPFEELYQKVISGEITDSITVAAALKIKLMLLDGSLK